MQKENLFFFSFPSASNFGEAKVTKKTRAEQNKIIYFLCRDGVPSPIYWQSSCSGKRPCGPSDEKKMSEMQKKIPFSFSSRVVKAIQKVSKSYSKKW